MHVRLTMTGPDAGSIRMAVGKKLAELDATATWTMEMETTPVFRAVGGDDATMDWSCEVTAWDGKDEPGMERHLWAVDDGEDG